MSCRVENGKAILRSGKESKLFNKLFEATGNIDQATDIYETVLISANDELVDLYIKNKIRFLDINKILVKILKLKKYSIMNRKKPKKISDIINLSEEVRLKTRNLCIELIKK